MAFPTCRSSDSSRRSRDHSLRASQWLPDHHHTIFWRVSCSQGSVFLQDTFSNPFNSQPFWGSMVASTGVGPRPIDYKLLNSTNLADAIRFCLTPSASSAAKKIGEKMSKECGVKQAVKSFHRNLPIKQMVCDVLPREAAVWQYEADGKQLKLSDEAAFILMDQKKLNMNNMKRYGMDDVSTRRHVLTDTDTSRNRWQSNTDVGIP